MASRSVGNIIVDLQARTAKFEEGLTRAEKRIRSLQNQVYKKKKAIDSTSETMDRYARRILAGVTVAAIVQVVRRQAELIDQTQKFADRLGIATGKLIALRHAAELTGVSSNTLDMALQRMTRRIAEAGQGTGEAVKALQELRLNAQEMAKLAPDQQFERIAAALQKIPDRATQIRLAFKLFDSEGVAVLNTLDKVARDGMGALEEETRKLGIALSRVDTAKVEAMNDALTRAQAASQGIAQQFTVGIAPAIAQIANAVADTGDGFSIWRTVGEAVGTSLRGIAFLAAGVGKIFVEAGQMLIATFNKPFQILQMLLAKAQALPAALIAIGEATFDIITNPIDAIRKFAADFIKTLAGAVTGLLEQSRESAEALFGNEALAKIDAAQAKVWGVARAISDGVEGEANQASVAIDEMNMKLRQAFAGTSTGEQTGIPWLQTLDADLEAAGAKIAQFMNDVVWNQPEIQAPETATAADPTTENPVLSMLGYTQQAFTQAREKLTQFMQWTRKLATDTANRIAEEERKKFQQRLDITENWANATFNLMRAFGSSSLTESKGFAIAEAIVNAALAATKAIAIYGPTPAGFAAAGAAIAFGAAQIAAIQKASKEGGSPSFGGGGGGSGGGGASGPVAPPPIEERTQTRDVNVTVNGVITRQAVEDIGEILNELKRDGALG